MSLNVQFQRLIQTRTSRYNEVPGQDFLGWVCEKLKNYSLPLQLQTAGAGAVDVSALSEQEDEKRGLPDRRGSCTAPQKGREVSRSAISPTVGT